jgi:hypothetical protein
VIIIIEEGQGFPLICEESHVADGQHIASLTDESMRPIPQKERSAVVFNSNIARQDSAVAAGRGGSAILLLY